MKTVDRYVDTREGLYSFEDEVLVVCPKCGACAKQIRTTEFDTDLKRPISSRRFVCANCGLTKEGGSLILPGYRWTVDSGMTLWLQTPCCGETLWAFNLRHIETIEAYVRADLREQHRHPTQGWSSGSFVNRLPKWIKAGNHREEILKGVARLKKKLPAGKAARGLG